MKLAKTKLCSFAINDEISRFWRQNSDFKFDFYFGAWLQTIYRFHIPNHDLCKAAINNCHGPESFKLKFLQGLICFQSSALTFESPCTSKDRAFFADSKYVTFYSVVVQQTVTEISKIAHTLALKQVCATRWRFCSHVERDFWMTIAGRKRNIST